MAFQCIPPPPIFPCIKKIPPRGIFVKRGNMLLQSSILLYFAIRWLIYVVLAIYTTYYRYIPPEFLFQDHYRKIALTVFLIHDLA